MTARVEPKKLWRFRRPRGRERARLQSREGLVGWAFIWPAFVGLVIFLFLPILFALWVSFRNWNGITSPFDSTFIGLDNYRELLTEPGIRRKDFFIAIRNNLYYVLGVVPIQTAVAFVLAVIVNQKYLKNKGFFRTAYYFPSITSSVAVALIFIFLFQVQGAVNFILPFETVNWLNNANGLIHNLLGVVGVHRPPGFLAETDVLGLSLWEWISGPSVTMSAIMLLNIWTTVGTFMLIFLAGLQNISPDVEEASAVDGASGLQRFRHITIPLMRPTIFFVVTLGLIGTWQVFDQVFVISFGGPQKTTVTPAFLTYLHTFVNSKAGLAAAVSVLLFLIIATFTFVQRRIVSDVGEA
ncbi:MAG: carbohydrate ABC transporter permease [Acidimicrobiia bacterium]